MHLIQDLELLSPLLVEAGSRENLRVVVYLTDRLYRSYPRVRQTLQARGVTYCILPYAAVFFGFVGNLKGFNALITAAESNARAHRVAHVMVRQANRQGLRTYTLQHGFEQPGLTYFDESSKPDSFKIVSQKIFLWGEVGNLPKQVSQDIKSRCIAVGCPKPAIFRTQTPKPPEASCLISVFENLHWERYGASYRDQFIKDLIQTAQTFPEAVFWVRPHPNNRWLAAERKDHLKGLSNIQLADPKDPQWELVTTPDLIAVSDAVITTPSTVALDAARADRPTAVVGNDLDVENYKPLVILRAAEDWKNFIRGIGGAACRTYQERGREFVKKNIISGEAARRILDTILLEAACLNLN